MFHSNSRPKDIQVKDLFISGHLEWNVELLSEIFNDRDDNEILVSHLPSDLNMTQSSGVIATMVVNQSKLVLLWLRRFLKWRNIITCMGKGIIYGR